MAVYTIELDGKQYDIEGDRPPNEQEARQAIGQMGQSVPQQATSPQMERQTLGAITNVPGATSRAAIQSNPALALAGPFAGSLAIMGVGGKEAQQAAGEGALNPSQVPTFQEGAANLASEGASYLPRPLVAPAAFVGSSVAQLGGLASDIVTDPTAVLTSVVGGLKPTGQVLKQGADAIASIPSKLKPILRWDKISQQAEKAKGALDALQKSYGSVYETALHDVRNVPTNVDFSKMPQKVLNEITNNKDTYGIVFNANGSINNTIGNVNKIKAAADDMITPAMRKEATKAEIAQIRQFSGNISGEMRIAARKAGKPIDEAMDAYGEFKKNYNLVNDRLVDKRNIAMSNKLKEITRLNADETVKEASKVLAKESPELKDVLNSRKNRELLKLLLKTTPVGIGVLGGGKVLIENSIH